MPATALLLALLAAPLPALELELAVARTPTQTDGRRAVLVVTARNAGPGDIVFLPRALAVSFEGAGARRQPFDEGPVLPPLWLDARTLSAGASTRIEIHATPADAAWQVPEGGGRRANWFLQPRRSHAARVSYAVSEASLPAGTPLPPGALWTGALSAGPVQLELP